MPNTRDRNTGSTYTSEEEALSSALDALISAPDALTLWRQILESLPLGVGILEAQTGRTLWINTALRKLLEEGVGASEVLTLLPCEYLPGMEKSNWEETIRPLQQSSSIRALPPCRAQLVHHSTRNIAYWEWEIQVLGEAQPPRYLMLTLQSVSDVVINERQLASAGRAANRARRRAEALVSLTQLVNISLTTPELLSAITHQAADYFDASHAAVLLLKPGSDRFDIGYSIGLQTGKDHLLMRANTLAGQALAQRQTLVQTPRDTQIFQTPLLSNGTRPLSVVSSPIGQEGRDYGVVEVYFTETREVSSEARAMLAAFADQTAIALHKADLYEQIGEQRRRLQSIFDNAPVDIIYFNTEGIAVAVNTAAARKYGQSAESLVGLRYQDFLRDLPSNLFDQVRDGMLFHASHFVMHLPDKEEVVCDLSLLPVRDDRGRVVGLLNLSFEVTELVKAQQEAETARQRAEALLAHLRTTQTQMVQVEKMRAIGELASGVAHDFNNALMAILGYAELAEDSLDDPETLASHLAIIRKAAEDASTTVQRLQSFARQRVVTSGNATDICVVVQDVVNMTRPHWRDSAQREGRNYEVRVELHPAPPIMAEPSGLREVLINMIHNALKAMPGGGTLTLVTRPHGDDEVEIEVGDTGVGMTPEVQARIFDPFFTTRGVDGTGLGLAVSWSIIQRHGGTIEVKSAPGKGTHFYLRLPVREGIPAVAPAPPIPLPASAPGIRLLVVDDEPFVASVLATILGRHGYQVTLAYNAEEALEHLRAGGESYQLVLTDHGMPGMTGLQLVEEIRHTWPGLPVVLLTGWGETLLQTHVTETLPDAVLGKPINQSDLLHAIAGVLRRKTAE
jgi:PAS domain S-box-containing protein